jgi:hypothetical protein
MGSSCHVPLIWSLLCDVYYTLLQNALSPELAVFERSFACARAAPVRDDVALFLRIYVRATPILQSEHFLAPCVFFVARFCPLRRLNWPQRSRLLIRTWENMIVHVRMILRSCYASIHRAHL